MDDKYIDLCRNGKLDGLKEMYHTYHINKDSAFRWSCYNDNLNIARWLYSLGGVDIHANNEEAFVYSCINGYLNIAKWLYSLGNVNIHVANDSAFRKSCRNGNLNTVQWLYSLGGIDIHAEDEEAFRGSCLNGHLNVAQWLYSLGGVNIHANNEEAFVYSCMNGSLNMAQWLYLDSIDIHNQSDPAFSSYSYKYIEIIKWLLIISKFDNELVDNYLLNYLYEYAFDQGYLPTNKMIPAYAEYKNKIKDKIKEKHENGNIGVFELSYLVDIILVYI